MKHLKDIINNSLITEDVNSDNLPLDKTFYVEIYVFSNKREILHDRFSCTDFSIFTNKVFVFNQQTGMYLCIIGHKDLLQEFSYTNYRSKIFPYLSVGKNYSCFSALNTFKQTALEHLIINPILKGKSLKYSFGLEFETAKGIIPEHMCYQNGLIPLHDGSITGIEYTSVVLEKPYGLTLLQKQLELLNKSTVFDKNCALHVHCGGYPVNIKAVYLLYLICVSIEDDLRKYNCPAVFQTDMYKDTGKNYCNSYNKKMSFSDFCYAMSAGQDSSISSLTNVHPADTGGDRKWNINIRYFWVNFINILYYQRAKTIEFRFLRPTWNFNKIVGWLYIFNAILMYAEYQWKILDEEYSKYYKSRKTKLDGPSPISWGSYYSKHTPNSLTLMEIISRVYENTPILPKIKDFLVNLNKQSIYETENNDVYGKTEVTTDNNFFTTNIALTDA